MCVPRVFTGDELDVVENLKRAVRDVCEIADGRGDEIQSAGHGPAYYLCNLWIDKGPGVEPGPLAG